jgi:hypothetical protein
MNLQEIKSAIESGKKVCWANSRYEVIKHKDGEFSIVCDNGHSIGLTWTDGKTLNGKEDDFYIDAGE